MCGADRGLPPSTFTREGSSPRVRSRPVARVPRGVPIGIISACAEQTIPACIRTGPPRDHLRVCGADPGLPATPLTRSGSSPRVRSRRIERVSQVFAEGIISACAEQTPSSTSGWCALTDHLRVCGADGFLGGITGRHTGSSPRVRSRPGQPLARDFTLGIISACAEQTSSVSNWNMPTMDHLRVCGADMDLGEGEQVYEGSSPRVRSRRRQNSHTLLSPRIISACAEQTAYGSSGPPGSWDHLRVCGADNYTADDWRQLYGSSPRVRSRPRRGATRRHRHGIISACAEQTWTWAKANESTKDHLRVCGADTIPMHDTYDNVGSSPRVRSRRLKP